MFELGKKYRFKDIKEKLGVDKGNSILKVKSKFVALCLTEESDFIKPNLMLVKNGSLIRKIGRSLANTKYPIKLFLRNNEEYDYTYLCDTSIIESKTAPKKVKSKLENFKNINSKDISRIIYLKIDDK